MVTSSSYPITAQLVALTRYGGMTPRLFERLFHHYGSLSGILDASSGSHESIDGITEAVARKLTAAAKHLPEAERYVEELKGREIGLTTRFDENYTDLLNELNDPPPLLYVRGAMPSANIKAVTLVGARNASVQGIALTTRLAQEFAKAGVQIISSLTGGNDAAAHLGARAAGGVSFAVVDTGFDNLEEIEQVPLAIDIAQAGGVVSEYAPEFAGDESSMEQADRLLVGLGRAVVVTELYQDSPRVHDILEFCAQIGKLAFVVIDAEYGPLADKESLAHAIKCGAIMLEGTRSVEDITKSLV